MSKRFNQSDPTANQAVANVMRERDRAPRRKLLAEFPDVFGDLMPHEAKKVALAAFVAADNDLLAITREHLEAAKREVRG
ncbi:hypothetical protein GCM10023340_36540 [Nocardioides marinquilinus]|uniref:Uncharacterized protein n=1 Tax=Nocardioides marinquilinus TaxID=1210400 RepID=A0ABP9Q1R3_9ACTN